MNRRDGWIAIGLVLALCAITIAFGERIGIHHGEGWDGEFYAAWARDFPREVLTHGVTQFQAGRVLPSAIIYGALGVVDGARGRDHVVLAYQLLDAACLVGAAAFAVAIARALAWPRWASWAGFASLFLGFCSARAALYYPVETDPLAFLLATAIAWAYVARQPIVTALAIACAALTWPALVAFGIVLLLLPRARAALPPTTPRWQHALAIALGVAAAAGVAIAIEVAVANPIDPGGWDGAPKFLAYAHRGLEPITVGYIALSTGLAAYWVARADRTWSVVAYLRQLAIVQTVLAIAFVIAVHYAGGWWADRVGTQGKGFTWRDLRNYYAVNAIRAPLFSVVHQVVYYGPIVLVAIGAWRKVAATAAQWGPGAIVALGVVVLTAVNPDGRHLIHLFPFVVVAVISATAEWWTPRRLAGYVVLALAWSKLWFVIGYREIHDRPGLPGSHEWPDQRWFMHHGPWANDEAYLWHLGAMVVTIAALVALARVRWFASAAFRSPPAAASPRPTASPSPPAST